MLSPHVLIDNIHLGVAPSWSKFALGIAVSMIAYTGIETISNMSEEAKEATKTVPRAAGLVVAAVLGLYLLIPIVALSAMPVVHDAVGSGYHTRSARNTPTTRSSASSRTSASPTDRPKSSATTSASSPR